MKALEISDTAKIIDAIIEIVRSYLNPSRIILFGSRAEGKGKKYADFDIAVEGVEMDIRTERKIKESLDERLGVYTVDLINLDKVDKEFKSLVLEKGMVIYGQ